MDLSSDSQSSSSDLIVESSSDAAVLQHARNIASECMKVYGAKIDLLDDLDGIPPSATYYVSAAGEMKVVLENFYLPCGAIVSDVGVSLSGDTLYAEPAYDASSMLADCVCPTQISFEIENALAYAAALYLSFDRDKVMPLKEGTALSEKERLKKTGFVRGTCQKDEATAVETRAASASGSKDLPVALLGFENGMYVMTVSNVEDYCKIETRVLQKRSGDTLFVDYEDLSNASRCICTFDKHKFAVDTENADVKYFSFRSTLFRVDRMVYD